MQHTIFGLIALNVAAFVLSALWAVKEVKEAIDFGLLSEWSFK